MTWGDSKKTIEQRFWSRVDKNSKNGCWLWQGVKSGGYGYMRYYKDGRRKSCHLVSLIIHGIKVPKGKEVDHSCRNKSCVNPSHLEVVTHKENILRGTSIPARNSKKICCMHGHELTLDNIFSSKRGDRQCKKCRSNNYYRKSNPTIKGRYKKYE